MSQRSRNEYEYFDTFEEGEALIPIRKMQRKHMRMKQNWNPHHKAQGAPVEAARQIAEQTDSRQDFDFTYLASRHEREWIIDSLGGFYEGQWLDDVLRLVKGGKEAHVYQCQANPSVPGLDQPYLAAKVYRPRRFRSLKNDHVYRQSRQLLDSDGRLIKDHGMLHAIDKRTEYGRDLLQTSWIEHEFKALRRLHAAGCDVPVVYERGNMAILMTYFGEAELSAPTLNEVELDVTEARQLFQRVVYNIELMLANRLVHADLSAYNILYWEGEITLIDFPQSVDPLENREAYRIFQRDIRRVCEYFTRQGLKLEAYPLAEKLWKANRYPQGPEIHPALLDPQDDKDRKLWERTQRSSGT